MSGDDMFDECAQIAAQLLANKYADIARKATLTRTEIRREHGRAYSVEVDRVTGLTAEESKQAVEVDRFLLKGGVINYTRDNDGYRVGVHHYSRLRCTTIHGLATHKLSLTKATQAAVFEFFVHRVISRAVLRNSAVKITSTSSRR